MVVVLKQALLHSLRRKSMNDWIKQNISSLAIAGVTLISTFALYGYRIDNLEKNLATTQAQIASITTQQVQEQVSLAQIQVDLTYIKASLDRLTK